MVGRGRARQTADLSALSDGGDTVLRTRTKAALADVDNAQADPCSCSLQPSCHDAGIYPQHVKARAVQPCPLDRLMLPIRNTGGSLEVQDLAQSRLVPAEYRFACTWSIALASRPPMQDASGYPVLDDRE